MDDRSIVKRLIEIGLSARNERREEYARPSNEASLKELGAAVIANWLEELGRYRMVGDVQPCFANSQMGFEFQITEKAALIASDASELEEWLDTLFPPEPCFDVFLSYAAGDAALASELRDDLKRNGLSCFMAEKDVQVATEWQDSIRKALVGSRRVLLLLTPRSVERPWVLMETGAAWALGKPLIPALSHVDADKLLQPVQRYQAHAIETTAQRRALVDEIVRA